MTMTKLVIIHHLEDPNDLPALERWFRQHHCQEVLSQVPWTVRYVMYRAVPPPPGAEDFGYYNYRVHENWVRDERRGVKGLLSFTPQPGKMSAIVVNVPAEPTEDFLGAGLRHNEKTILRWLIAFRYPDGVSEQEGEEWYLNVHTKEVCSQPGLIRFFSHKAIPSVQPSPLPSSNAQKPFMTPSPLFFKQWHRVTELWYENNNGWVESVLKHPPRYTRPDWATHDGFPFLVPGEEFISTFILEHPDQDMLRHYEHLMF